MKTTRLPRSARAARLVLLGACIALLGSGCAAQPDPEVARESLSEVAEDPAPLETDEQYDAELHPEPIAEPLEECSNYLVITVRGTGEPSRGQLVSPVARLISKARPGEVHTVDLAYPADVEVKAGATHGVRLLIDTLDVQAEACPDQRFVLLGYSQGSLVIGDALSAPRDARMVGERAGQLGEAAADAVIAVVLYGDPRFVGAEPYAIGTFDPARNGLMPRDPGALDAFADRIRDFCVADDFICQAELVGFEQELNEEGHVAYFDNGMQHDGAAFAITRLDPPDPPKGDDADDADADGDDSRADSGEAAENGADPADSEQPLDER